jgi:hypothetical protein
VVSFGRTGAAAAVQGLGAKVAGGPAAAGAAGQAAAAAAAAGAAKGGPLGASVTFTY